MHALFRKWDLVLLAGLLAAASVPLLVSGTAPAALVYWPQLVAAGSGGASSRTRSRT